MKIDKDFDRITKEIAEAVDGVCLASEATLAESGPDRDQARQKVMRALASYTVAQAEHLFKASLHATRMRMMTTLITRSLKEDEIELLVTELSKRPNLTAGHASLATPEPS